MFSIVLSAGGQEGVLAGRLRLFSIQFKDRLLQN
jgi:hypothetical protein